MNIHVAYQDRPKTITCFLGLLTFDLLGPFGLLLEPFVGLVVLDLLVVVVLGLLVGVGLLVVLGLLVLALSLQSLSPMILSNFQSEGEAIDFPWRPSKAAPTHLRSQFGSTDSPM